MIRRPKWTSLRTSLDEAFIWNAKSSYRTFPTLNYPLSFTVGDGSHCVTSQSLVHPCWYKSSTPTCMDLIFQYLSFLLAFKVRTLWSFRVLYSTCFLSREKRILTTLIMIIWGLCPKTSSCQLFVNVPLIRVIVNSLLVRPLLKVLVFLTWL